MRLDRHGVGDGLGHEAIEPAHRARVEEELVLVLEDALAEEDGDGDGDGREATRDGARVDGIAAARTRTTSNATSAARYPGESRLLS